MPSKNKVGDKVHLGASNVRGVPMGGDTLRPSHTLYYCGKNKGECRCGTCDGVCGPEYGCPCNACVEIVGFKVNGDGDLARRGTESGSASGGDTGRCSNDLFYCGKDKGECRCYGSDCDGKCGPNTGCPCESCLKLVGGRVDDDGDIVWDADSSADDDPSSSSSSEEEEDEWLERIRIQRTRRLRQNFQRPRLPSPPMVNENVPLPRRSRPRFPSPPVLDEHLNSAGRRCGRGRVGGNGGSTGMDAGQVFYCGQTAMVVCTCNPGGSPSPSCVNGVCGPDSGCPCNPCLELTFELLLSNGVQSSLNLSSQSSSSSSSSSANNNNNETVQSTTETAIAAAAAENHNGRTKTAPSCGTAVGDAENANTCIICWERKKTHLLVPCGHYSYCGVCVGTLQECALCRCKVCSKVKVFDG